MASRIADPWGPRTPFDAGEPWPVRVDVHLQPGVSMEDVDRWVQSASVLHSNGDGVGHRRQGRPDRRRSRSSGRPGEPWTARPEGPVRLAGQSLGGPADAPAGARGRRARPGPTGTRRWPDRRALQSAARRPGRVGPFRLLHQRPAVPRGVLHTRSHREGRHRHAAHGRQHPPVHSDRGRGAEGELRHRRAAGLLHRHRSLRRASPCGATTWPRPRPCCGCACSIGVAGPDPPALLAVDPRPPRWPARPTSIWRRATAPTWRC